jgi:hypothetical protein
MNELHAMSFTLNTCARLRKGVCVTIRKSHAAAHLLHQDSGACEHELLLLLAELHLNLQPERYCHDGGSRECMKRLRGVFRLLEHLSYTSGVVFCFDKKAITYDNVDQAHLSTIYAW